MKLKTMIVCLLALMAPLAYAHEPSGTPKLYCEPSAEWNTHEYGPPATSFLISGFIDGNLDDCDADFDPTNPICWAEEITREDLDGDGLVCEAFDYDQHAEYSRGGAWLLSCDEFCGLAGTGSGATLCFGEGAHHSTLPTVRAVDASTLTGVEFWVAADFVNLIGPDPLTGLDCGDFESDEASQCFDVCGVTFIPGNDGSYQVYVLGTQGHVCTPSCGGEAPAPEAGVCAYYRADGTRYGLSVGTDGVNGNPEQFPDGIQAFAADIQDGTMDGDGNAGGSYDAGFTSGGAHVKQAARNEPDPDPGCEWIKNN